MDYLIIILNAPKRTRECCESLSGESSVVGTSQGSLLQERKACAQYVL